MSKNNRESEQILMRDSITSTRCHLYAESVQYRWTIAIERLLIGVGCIAFWLVTANVVGLWPK